MIPGANTDGDISRRSDIEESMKISAAANANVLDGLVFVSNGNGLMAWDGNRVVEVTHNVRANSGNSLFSYFQNQALLPDPQKRRIIGTGSFVYDLGMKKLFQWGASGFRWTSRILTDEKRGGIRRPFGVQKIALYFENTTQANGIIKYQVKRDRNTWENVQEITVRFQEEDFVRVESTLEDEFDSKQFQMRITSLPSHIHIHSIDVFTDMSIGTEESPAQ